MPLRLLVAALLLLLSASVASAAERPSAPPVAPPAAGPPAGGGSDLVLPAVVPGALGAPISPQNGLVKEVSTPILAHPTAVGQGTLATGKYMPVEGIGFAALSTGDVGVFNSTENTSPSTGTGFGTSARGGRDVSQLKLDLNVPAGASCLEMSFVFYSEEYPEYVGSQYNDAFVAELDQSTWSVSGSSVSAPDNFAFDADGNPVTVNSTNFADGSDTGLEFDGSTQLLLAATPITPGQHELYLTIFDVGDSAYDSAVLIDNLRTYPAGPGGCTAGAATQDTDGDGLLDTWETQGLDADQDGDIDVDLPGMGAKVDHKDLFIEMDAMSGLRLSNQALKRVIDAFAAAPVSNPDGKSGITMHIDNGGSSLMDPPTGRTWGARSKSNVVPLQKSLGTFSGKEYNWSAFQQLKNDHFDAARRPAFRYAMSINRYGGSGSSGIARGIPGSDFIVSLGMTCTPEAVCGADGPGGIGAQAGTFMHELGHTLGLKHGGGDHLTYKPNYLSVMNYHFQFDGIPGRTPTFDYSRWAPSTMWTLNEHGLDEPTGLTLGVLESLNAVSGRVLCATSPKVIANNINAHGPVDFNCDGKSDGVDIKRDVNFDGEFTTEMRGGTHNWNEIRFRGGSVGGYGLEALQPDATEADEPPVQDLIEASESITPAPEPTTLEARDVGADRATLAGRLNPNGNDVEWAFQYGIGDFTEHTAWVPAAAGAAREVTLPVDGLTGGATYQFRLVARNATQVVPGATQTFVAGQVAGPLPPPAPGGDPGPAPGPGLAPGPPPITIASAKPCAKLKGKKRTACLRTEKIKRELRACSAKKGARAKSACRVRVAVRYKACARLKRAEKRSCTRKLAAKRKPGRR